MTKVAAAVIRQNGKILICKRGAGGNCAFLWEFPGGKQEEAESPEDCAVRECREELGITIRLTGSAVRLTWDYPDRTIDFTFFEAVPVSGSLTPAVHEEIRWVSPEELADYEFCPADVELVRALSAGQLPGQEPPKKGKLPV